MQIINLHAIKLPIDMSLYKYCLVVCAILIGCSDATESPQVQIPVFVDNSAVVTTTTTLGYQVEVTELRIAMKNFLFTSAGELHTAFPWPKLVQTAFAHPGHFQDGEVLGELRGEYIVDFIASDRQLGEATLIEGQYTGANFTFDRAPETQLSANDTLIGHTAIISGNATKNNQTLSFTITIDSPVDRELVGAPFEVEISPSTTGRLYLRFHTRDPFEDKSIFEGIDFITLDSDNDSQVDIGPDTNTNDYNLFRRNFQTHDFYTFVFEGI